MSAERFTGSGRRSRTQQARKDTEAAAEERHAAGALVTLSNVGPSPLTDQPAEEHHLGDRLSGFVDGELDHDARDRVQAHLATCSDCLAEAEDERAVKQLLSEAVAPEPSPLLLGRLLAVGMDRPDDGEGTFGDSRLDGGGFGRGTGGGSFGRGGGFGTGALGAASPLPGVDPRAPQHDAYLPAVTRLRSVVAPSDGRPSGTAADRSARLSAARLSAARGRRFVFVAAGAFSVAAFALTGFSGLGGVEGVPEEPYGISVSPVAELGPGAGDVSPMNVPLREPVRAGYPIPAPLLGSPGGAPRLPDSSAPSPSATDLLSAVR